MRIYRHVSTCVPILLLIVAACTGSHVSPIPGRSPSPTTRSIAQSQPDANLPQIPLWDAPAPEARGSTAADMPTLTYFPARPGTRPSAVVIVCPGGAYGHLAYHEGAPVARWLNTVGITSFVLKYRLGPTYHHPVEMHDAQRAVRYVRAHASQWNIDPNRVGILGFSAGGHLASTVATHFDAGDAKATDPIDRLSCRPDLALLIYPVITMRDPFTHPASRLFLLGKSPDPTLIQLLSNELQVTPQTPPCFLVSTMDDRTAQIENSLEFFEACRQNQVPAELHIFEHGKHGYGLARGFGKDDPILSTWPNLAENWLRRHNFTQ